MKIRSTQSIFAMFNQTFSAFFSYFHNQVMVPSHFQSPLFPFLNQLEANSFLMIQKFQLLLRSKFDFLKQKQPHLHLLQILQYFYIQSFFSKSFNIYLFFNSCFVIFINLNFMQEVLSQLYQDHRKELVYNRRHFVEVKQRQERKVKSFGKKSDLKQFSNKYGKSVDLSQKRSGKERRQKSSPQKNYKLLSKQDGQILKKYIQNYAQKETRLPRINNSFQVQSYSTKVEQNSENTLNSFKSARRNFTIRKQKVRRNQGVPKKSNNLKRLRKCVNVVIFIIKTQNKVKQNEKRFKRTEKLSQNLLKMIDKLVNKYYIDLLKEPLLTYERILSKKINQKSYNANDNIVMNLVQFSEKLKESSIRKDILQFLILISLHNAYVPVDYFSQFELLRLDFHSHSQKIARVSNQQLKMIVGVFMGIKILCLYMFYEPWNIRVIDLDIKGNQKTLRPLIWAYSSFFYWSILQIFEEMKSKNYKFLQRLIKRGWEPMFIHQESNQFFQATKKNHRKKFQFIIANLKEWIQRISLAVLKHREDYWI